MLRTLPDGTQVAESRPVSWLTVAKDYRVLHRLLAYAVAKDYIDFSPATGVPAPKGDPRTPPILSDDEYERLLSQLERDPMAHIDALLGGDGGLRSGERRGLQWRHIDLPNGTITIRSEPGARTKSGRSRVVPMTARLKAALTTHAESYRLGREYVLTHTEASALTTKGAKVGDPRKSFRSAFMAAAKRANLPRGFRPHDLRHRRATTWMAEGHAPQLVQLALGHASIATTMQYSHLNAEHLRSLVDKPTSTAGSAAETAR